MQKKLILFITLILFSFGLSACQNAANSPTASYQQLYQAVHSKDTAKVKSLMSKDSLGFAEFAAGQQKKSADDILQNGFIDGNLSPTMPMIRDERIKDNFGALEVQGTNGTWTDVPFVLEDGTWKIAVGDMFKGTYQKPSPSQSERENPNPTMVPAPAENSANMPAAPLVPKPNQMPNANLAVPKMETNKPLPGANANAAK